MDPGHARRIAVHGTPTRAGVPSRDKAELRGAMQDSVHEFTTLRRARLLPVIRAEHPLWTEAEVMDELDARQPAYEEYDPVVQLAVMAADHSNSVELRRQAASDAAQYVRPKLKAIEMTVDPATAEARAERALLAERLVALLDAGAVAKRATVVEQARSSVAPGPVVDQDGS